MLLDEPVELDGMVLLVDDPAERKAANLVVIQLAISPS